MGCRERTESQQVRRVCEMAEDEGARGEIAYDATCEGSDSAADLVVCAALGVEEGEE